MNTKDIFKKSISILIIIALLFPFIGEVVYGAEENQKELIVGNDFVEYTISKKNGRFSIRTVDGSPWREGDDDKQLLYKNIVPDTSFTTFRIDGEDYIYGNDYGFLGTEGYFVEGVTRNSGVSESTWKVKGIEITQKLQIYEDSKNPYVGNVKVTYKVKNTNDVTSQIGSRILLDTMLGANDAQPVVLDGSSQYINLETDLRSSSVPDYWRASDDPLNPKILSYGFLSGYGNRKPDRMIIGHWEGLSETKWDYIVDEGMNFTTKKNKYDSADSAIAIYWEPSFLSPGQEVTYETYYGLGNFYTSNEKANYGLQVVAPEKLTLNDNKDGYNEEEFDITVEIDNSINDAKTLNNMQVSLAITEGLEVIEGASVQNIHELQKGKIQTVSWKVKAKPQEIYKVYQYSVTVTASKLQDEVKGGYIILPALSGEPPQVQLRSVLPNMLYYEEEQKRITLNGKGFEILKADNDWNVQITRERDLKTTIVKREDISIVDDKSILLTTDDELWKDIFENEPSSYKITLNANQYGTFTKKVKLTEDKAYISRAYGVLLVVGKNISEERSLNSDDEECYEILTANDTYNRESFLNNLNRYSKYDDDNQILLEIKGDIKEYNTDAGYEYYIEPGCYINSVIEYGTNDFLKSLYGENSQNMTIKQKVNSNGEKIGIDIKGNGSLSIPSFPFVQGNFSIELIDEERYSLKPDEDNGEKPVLVNWDIMEGMKFLNYISVFPVKLKNAAIGDKSVSFGGSAYLNIGGNIYGSGDKENDDDGNQGTLQNPNNTGNTTDEDNEAKDLDSGFGSAAGIGLSIHELKFGYREKSSLFGPANEYGFIGINAEGNASMPKDLIPGLDFGASGRVRVDTLDDIYEVEIEVKFAVVEFAGLISLRFIDGTYPIPDSIKGSIGGEPGIPIIPVAPVVYITGGGLGFENLYDTVTHNFNVLPPLKLIFQGSVQVLKVIEGSDITLELSLQEMSLSGDLSIMKLDLLRNIHGSMKFIDEGGGGLVLELGGEINVFDVLVGEVNVGGGYDSTYDGVFGPYVLYGNGDVSIQVPSAIPVIGGMSVTGAKAEISTKHAYAVAKFLGIPVGIEYVWGDSKVNIISPKDSDVDEFASSGGFRKVYYNEDGKYEGVMTFANNVTRSMQKDNSILVDDKEAIIFEIEYMDQIPDLKVYKPDGSLYELIENTNYRVQELSSDQSQSGFDEKRVYVSVLNPDSGTWRIEADKEIEVALLDIKIPASIDSLSIRQLDNLNSFEATFATSHINNEKVSLYLCKDESDVGVLIADGIDTLDGSYTFEVPSNYSTGDYYIRAVLYKDDTNYDSIVGEETIKIIDLNQPLDPSNLIVSQVGNGVLKVDFDKIDDADGYYIDIKDQDYKTLEGIGAIEVDGDSENVYIGGTYKDVDGNDMGLIPGNTYIVSMVAYREVDNIKHYSNEVFSMPIYLPNPNPPSLAFGVSANEGSVRVTQDSNGKNIYTVNKSTIDLSIQSDQNVGISLYLNNESLDSISGTDINKTIELSEGENLIQIKAENDNKDTSMYGITVRSDTKNPELKVNEIEKEVIDGVELVKIKGVTELGSVAKINDEIVEVDNEGVFERYLSINDKMVLDAVIKSEDAAGNISTYTTKIYNDDIDNIDRVVIKSTDLITIDDEGNILKTPRAKILDDVLLELYCIDNLGNEYLVNPDDVDFDMMIDNNVGDVDSSGRLNLRNEGDIIVKASYFVSDEYAFEDAISIEVIKDIQEDDNNNDDVDNDDFTPLPEEDKTEPVINPPAQDEEEEEEESSIDELIKGILKRLIDNDENMSLLNQKWITGKDNEVINDEDGKLSITIPKQAFEGKIALGIWKVDEKEEYKKGGAIFASEIYEIVLDKDEALDERAQLKIKYDKEKFEDTKGLAIYWYDEAKKRWEYVGGTIDEENGTITVTLSHFSKYALLKNSNLVSFEDIDGTWYEDLVYSLSSIGVIDGIRIKDKTYYEPDRYITRQEFAKLLVKATDSILGLERSLEGYADYIKISNWALPYMKVAIENNWLIGIKKWDGIYLEPNRELTRAEAAVMTTRVLDSNEIANGDEKTSFLDDSDIPKWAKPHIKELSDRGVIVGYPDNTYRANDLITRREAATIIYKLIEENR